MGEITASAGGDIETLIAAVGELGAKYGLESDPESIPRLLEEHGLEIPS